MPAPLPADPYELGLKFSGEGRHADAIAQYEHALAARPDDVRVLFALGNTARALGMPKPAEEFFRRVLAQEPARLEALVNLANLMRAQEQFAAAEALLAPALSRTPDSPELWLTLGSTYRELGETVRAADHYRQALALKSNYVPALTNLADILTDDGARDEALALYDRAITLDPQNAQAKLNRSILHFLEGNLRDGWRDYAARLKIAGKVPLPEHKLARWIGGSLKRTRLLVRAEQGVGDQIMFASLMPDIIARADRDGGSVILECEPRLVPLFARSFPKATVHGSDLENRGGVTRARYNWLKQAGGANAFIEMGSLPKYLRPDLDSFPADHAFLKPNAMDMARFGALLESCGSGPFIGVSWRSGNLAGHRTLQYAPREAWAAFIAQLPGTVVSAQYGATADEVEALSQASGRPIIFISDLDQKNELDRTAALLASLDAVASAPTAVAWLAACTGVDTYKILYDTSWTALGQPREPFAPACELAMPARRGDWTSAFAHALQRISARL